MSSAASIGVQSLMYIAMNQFRVKPGAGAEFERAWRERQSYLSEVPGFESFHLLRGPLEESADRRRDRDGQREKEDRRRGEGRRPQEPSQRLLCHDSTVSYEIRSNHFSGC